MSENEAQQSIAELFRQLKEGGKALDVEKRILESLLRRAGEELGWFCNCCGKKLPESRRKQAIEDLVNWRGISSFRPRARHTSWADWVEEIFYQHVGPSLAAVEGRKGGAGLVRRPKGAGAASQRAGQGARYGLHSRQGYFEGLSHGPRRIAACVSPATRRSGCSSIRAPDSNLQSVIHLCHI